MAKSIHPAKALLQIIRAHVTIENILLTKSHESHLGSLQQYHSPLLVKFRIIHRGGRIYV